MKLQSPHPPGQAGRLHEIALVLQRAAPLMPCPVQLVDIGYQLLTGAAPQAVKAPHIELTRDVNVADGLRAILRACMAHLFHNQDVALVHSTAEGVHQMRVAVRRLRSAIRVFADIIDSGDDAWIEGELKWLGVELGRVRDWDVFVTKTLEAVRKAGGAGRHAGDALAPAARERQQSARDELAKLTRSNRYATLMLTLGAWVEEDRWCERLETKARLADPLVDLGNEVLSDLDAKVRKAGRCIRQLDASERHRLRKRLKRLRYGADFLSYLYPRKKVRNYTRPLSDLQDILGELNDLAAAKNLLKDLAGTDDLQKHADLLRAQFDSRARRLLAQLYPAWRRFKATNGFWN